MIKTTQIAVNRAFDETKTVLPTEVARGVYIENPPGAEALKLMHLLIGKAGGRMADNMRHELRLADIKAIEGMRNHTRSTLRKLFIELSSAVIVFDDTEAQCELIGGFLDRAKLDYRHEVSDDLLVAWWFGGVFREIADKSCHWVILDRQTVFALSSKYSILLFQHIASLVNLNHMTSKNFTVAKLRAVLGVRDGKLSTWNDMNKRALSPAIAEINKTSRLTLIATPHKIGRTVASVTISWEDNRQGVNPPKIKHTAHHANTIKNIKPAFPASGDITYDHHWKRIKQAAKCNMCDSLIAEKFRTWCAKREIALNAHNIEQIFSQFCTKVGYL